MRICLNRKCPYSLAVALACRVAKATLEKLTSGKTAPAIHSSIQVDSISSTSPHHTIGSNSSNNITSESSPSVPSPAAAASTATSVPNPSSSPSSSDPSSFSSSSILGKDQPIISENPLGFVADSTSLKKESLETLFQVCSEFAGKSAAETASICEEFSSGPLSSTSAIRNGRRSMEDRHVVIHDLNKICNINVSNALRLSRHVTRNHEPAAEEMMSPHLLTVTGHSVRVFLSCL